MRTGCTFPHHVILKHETTFFFTRGLCEAHGHDICLPRPFEKREREREREGESPFWTLWAHWDPIRVYPDPDMAPKGPKGPKLVEAGPGSGLGPMGPYGALNIYIYIYISVYI